MAKLENQKPWKVEYAKSARSSCKTCRSNIGKEVLRLGKMVQATQFDGLMPMGNHATCILKKAKQIKIDDVEGIEQLRWEDQQRSGVKWRTVVVMLLNPQNQKLSRMWNVISKFLKLLVPLAGPAAKKISKGEGGTCSSSV